MKDEAKKQRHILCPFTNCARMEKCVSCHEDEIQQYKDLCQNLCLELKKIKEKQAELFTLHDRGFQIIGLDCTERGEPLVVISELWKCGMPSTISFYLFSLGLKDVAPYRGEMLFTFSSRSAAYLEDWNTTQQNIGYGSIFMKHAISFLRAVGCERIDGTMSDVDRNRWDQLQHFYEKFGFTIIDCGKTKHIELQLW